MRATLKQYDEEDDDYSDGDGDDDDEDNEDDHGDTYEISSSQGKKCPAKRARSS